MVAKFIFSFFDYRFLKNNLTIIDITNISTKFTLYCIESFGYANKIRSYIPVCGCNSTR